MSRTIPVSLHALRWHSIFLSPSGYTDNDWVLIERPFEPLVEQKTSRMVMRDKDLIVTVGKELRMTSLGGGEGWDVRGGIVGSFKTLKTGHLGFTMQQIVLNPTGRLLAVVGHHQILIVVLPRSGFVGTSGGVVNCRSFAIDEFQFSPSSNVAVTKVIWHPWGEGGDSLWVLTADGKLREYDVSQSQDPTQTFSFLPSASSSSSFSAVDALSRYATSFAFGVGKYDFGPLMVHVLMANGDTFTMGPVLPLHAEVPVRYLQGLKAFTAGRLRRLEKTEDKDSVKYSTSLVRVSLQAQWVESLVRQARQRDETRRQRQEGELATPFQRSSLLSPRQRMTAPDITSKRNNRAPVEGAVSVHPPHLTETGGPAPGVHRGIMRQGPWVYNPGPQDIEIGTEEDEQVASDLYITSVTGNPEEEDEGVEREELIVVAIAWSGGRVDLGVEMEKPEPQWIASRDQSSISPTLPILESILVPLPRQDPTETTTSAPCVLADPLYSDILHVQHKFGVDTICLKPWLDAMRAEEDMKPSEVTRLVESTGSPMKPIIGVATFCNIALGYGMIALASSHQLAAVEMDFRIANSATELPLSPVKVAKELTIEEERHGQSLLLAKPLDIGRLVTSIRHPGDYNPRALARKHSEHSKPIQTVSPGHLRVLGEMTSQVQARTQAIRAASQAIESRLDLQVREFQRQLRLVKECSSRIAELKNGSMRIHAEKLLDDQSQLGDRLDRVLVAMSGEYKPQIGEAERRWFDELERLKARIRGGGPGRGKGLVGRVHVLQEQLASVKPHIQSQRDPEGADQPAVESYRSKQLRPLEVALSARSDEIRRLLRKMETLNMKLEVRSADDDEPD